MTENRIDGSPCVPLTAEERLDLAGATARGPRASVLDKDNVAVRTTRISNAVEEDVSFFVEVHPGILALDLDDASARATAQHLAAVLLMEGYAPVITRSGSDERRHVLARMPQANRHSVLRRVGLELGRKETRSTIRPPGALHRSGQTRNELLLPTSAPLATARLAGINRIRPLGPEAKWLFNQAALRRGESVSERMFSLAMGAANAGWTFEDFLTVITCDGVPASALLADRIERRGLAHTDRWLASEIWPNAVSQVTQTPPRHVQENDPELLALASAALNTPWNGRAGSTDFSVVMSMFSKRLDSGRSHFDLSQREICRAAGISSRATVQASLTRLVAQGLIRPVGERPSDPRARVRNSQRWEVTLEHKGDVGLDYPTLRRVLEALSSDVFRNNVGLGGRTGHLFAALIYRRSASAAELARMTGISARCCRQHLAEMQAEGLITSEDGEFAVGPLDLDVVAKELGAAGRAERQEEQFKREREARDIIHRE